MQGRSAVAIVAVVFGHSLFQRPASHWVRGCGFGTHCRRAGAIGTVASGHPLGEQPGSHCVWCIYYIIRWSNGQH